MFPRPIELTRFTPLPLSLTFSLDCVPGLTSKITLPVNVGISFLQPKIASVIVRGTCK